MLKKIFFFLALFWAGVIAFFCLIKSSDVPHVSDIPNLDKVVHAFFHFVFTSLWFLVFKKQFGEESISKALVVSFLFSLFFGISIEILQELFTATRHADIYDVLSNESGATLAVIVILLLNKYKKLDII